MNEVNLLAFGQEDEARLVVSIRESDYYINTLSLVAVEGSLIVGHILFSPIQIEFKGKSKEALSLAPMAVRPEYQNRGVGSELVREGLKACKRLKYTLVVVIGHPNYYPRFGFIQARSLGLEVSFPVPDEAFMVKELVPGALADIRGVVRFSPPFEDVL